MKQIILTCGLLFSMASFAYTQKSQIFKTDDGAIRGYDPVAYFKSGKAEKGNDEFTFKWNDASWHFVSKENLDAFKASPEKYAPQYGGYCAYGASDGDGHKAPTQPEEAWTILNGKLYLNYNKDVKVLWDKDRPGFIKKADKNWPAIKDKK